MKNLSLGLILGLFVFFTPSFAEVNTESIIQIFQRLETLEQKTRELHGENEVLTNQIEQLKKTQKQGFLNVDERIDELSNTIKASSSQGADSSETKPEPTVKVVDPKPAVATPAATPEKKETPVAKPEVAKPSIQTPPAAKTPAAEKPAAAKTEEAKPEPTASTTASGSSQSSPRAPTDYEKETYQAAFNKMGSSPTAATKAFQEYIKMQPNSPLAANAQYWIGEIMYSHNNYKGAVDEFIKVLQKYKNSNKAPDAAIKLGYSFYALKNWPYARRTFEDVLKYFPKNENAVKLATQRLEKMKAAGH
ncbi:hypothetical protein GCM10009133_32420 [Cocleimonas flava]|uniref:Cell division coordinator CpoB n=1 Tax=Cocleimonas flava TaxID=634765 RepID=A0A4R1F862_9GAMM|nr:tol-pal system protein YbgF [Cocleimonas flava]TCJ88912.1 tol-pal system protein YbgF [Cocleimonas flava]